jgi:formate C-acetyltransferase
MRDINTCVEAANSWIKTCMGDTDEKFREAWQTPGCVWVTDEERAMLLDAYDYWKDRDIASHVWGLMPDFVREHQGNGVSSPTPFESMRLPQGHFVANFEKAIKVGFGAVRKQAEEKLAEIEKNVTHENVRSHAFYRAVIKVCDGAVLMSKRYAEACRAKAAQTSDPVRKAELLRMADSCDWIMENPARTLWEGLQVIIFYQNMLTADGQQHGQSIANVDRYVAELLENDLKNGTLTQAQAQELFDAFVCVLATLL